MGPRSGDSGANGSEDRAARRLVEFEQLRGRGAPDVTTGDDDPAEPGERTEGSDREQGGDDDPPAESAESDEPVE